MIVRPLRTVLILLRAAVVCCVLCLGAACSSSAPESPPVPSIEPPKAAVGIDPCALLSGADAAELGLRDERPGQDELGANCQWRGRNASAVRLTAYTSGAGLSDLTKGRDPATSRVRLLRYPALETFTEGGEFCRYDVGVAQRQAIVATMSRGEPDSCTALQRLLTVVVQRLGGVSESPAIGG